MRKIISIIIVTYNSSKLIFDCIDSIYKYNDIGNGLEVIVVDNNSQEGNDMFASIHEKYSENVITIRNDKNGGYGYGNNVGIDNSKSDIVIVMNPDVRFVIPLLDKISNYFKNDNDLGMLGVDFVDGSCPYYFKRGYGTVLNTFFYKYYLRRKKYDAKKMFMSGSFLAFRKQTFQSAGKFDENIFMYSEEADITNRILEIGKKVLWCSELKVLHLAHGRSFNQKLNEIRLESGLYYEKKYNIDIRKSYRVELVILRLKYLVAKLCGDKDKSDFFYLNIKNLVSFYKDKL